MKHNKGMLFCVIVCLLYPGIRLVDADAFLLVADSDNGTISKGSISLGLADLTPLPFIDVVCPTAVDFDPIEQMVYWTDTGAPSPKISKARIDGSGQTPLVNELNEPVGLALDIVARMVYWTDEVGHIARIPMDGSGTKEVIVEDISCPSGIIVHRESGLIYWADSDNNGIIERAYLDGTNRETIVQEHMMSPSGLAIDYQENQLYWCDTELQKIERKELPDSPGLREVVIDQHSHDGRYAPFDLVFYNDNLYWSDSGVNRLFRAYKNGEREMIYGSPSTIFKKVRGIHLFEVFCDSTSCMNGGTCTSLTAGFSCQCAPGYEGEVCQIEFCDSSPCMNGGTCVHPMYCHCATGFKGNLCQLVDGCELTHDVMDNVTVDPPKRVFSLGEWVTLGCPDGYEFRGSTMWFCQNDFKWNENQAECIPLATCESSPCVNGTCTSLTPHDFTCHCEPGYGGQLCDTAQPGCFPPPVSSQLKIPQTESFFKPGDEVLFACDNGYVIQGSKDYSRRRVCSAEGGSWSGSDIKCVTNNEGYIVIICVTVGAVAITLIGAVSIGIAIKWRTNRNRRGHVGHPEDNPAYLAYDQRYDSNE
ncbi:low-density lipoprotein receptor-related protein 2-like isoform X2 [Asterias amurensis]